MIGRENGNAHCCDVGITWPQFHALELFTIFLTSDSDMHQRSQTISLVILATIATGFSLYFLKTVLLPFIIAVFIVIGCRPILEFVGRKLRLPQLVAFAVTFTIGLAVLVAVCVLIGVSVNDMSKNLGVYESRLNTIVAWVQDQIPAASSESLESELADDALPGEFGLGESLSDPSTDDEVADEDQTADEASGSEQDGNEPADNQLATDKVKTETNTEETPADTGSPNETPDVSVATISAAVKRAQPRISATQAIKELVNASSDYIRGTLLDLAGSLSSLSSYAVLIMIFVFFLLLGDGGTSTSESKAQTLLKEIEAQVRKYLVMKTIISFFTAFAFGGVLWLFGVPLAIVFGVLAFFLNYIPNIGPLLACVLPLPFLVLNSGISPTMACICFILISTVQLVSGNVIETRIMGQSFDVSPVALLLALMFFGLIWGIIGMFLATPLVSITKIVLQQSEGGRPLAELLAGRLSMGEESSVAE